MWLGATPLGIPVGSSWLPQAFPAPGVARERGTTYWGQSAREPGGGAQHPAKPLLGKGRGARRLMGSGRVHEIESPLT